MRKRTRRPAGKAAPSKRKTVMRHAREGVRGRKPKPSSGSRPAAKRKQKAKAKATRPAKAARAKKATRSAAPARRRSKPAPSTKRRGQAGRDFGTPPDSRGLGPDSAGQSGDTEGLSRVEEADSESVEELLEEGQSFEAGVISGVENARDADRGGVRTRQVPEDDVPQEYLDKD